MTAFAFYLLKVLVCSGFLFLYYLLALRNKAFHQWNRFYLLSAVALSIALPLVQIVVTLADSQSTAVQLIQVVQSADDYMEAITVSSRPHISTEQWLAAGYAFASFLLLTGIVLLPVKLHRLAKKWGVQRVDGIRFVNTAEPGTPFSFLRSIFWNRDIPLDSEAGRQIFQHELVHVKEKHTLDKLFLQAVLVVFWCNPFFWLIKKELRFIHEFIADQHSVGEAGTAAFAAMVLQTAYPSHYQSLVNPFFQTSIKRRLLMLTKIQNTRLNYLSRIVALPLIAVVAFAFTVRTGEKPVKPTASLPVVLVNADTIPKAKKEIESVDVNRAKSLLTVYYTDGSCETMTEQEASKRGLVNNGGYGNVTVNNSANRDFRDSSVKLRTKLPTPLYVIDNIEASPEAANKLDPNTIASIDVLKGESAVKFYGEKAKNGVVEITTKDYKAATLGSHPLYLLDGIEIPEKKMSVIDPNRIESINVLKGPSAVAKYGNKGENGVIEIKTKSTAGGSIKFQTDEMTGTIDSLKIESTTPLRINANVNANDRPSQNTNNNASKNDLTEIRVIGRPSRNANVNVDDRPSQNTNNNASKNDLTEVTVIGRPSRNEPVFTQTETPATVDKNEWQAFLIKKAQPVVDDMTRKGAKPGNHVANIRFLVEKDGSLSNVTLLNKIGYDADDKVLQMMKDSPKWIPAQQNGKAVRSYHTQPITFMISNQ